MSPKMFVMEPKPPIARSEGRGGRREHLPQIKPPSHAAHPRGGDPVRQRPRGPAEAAAANFGRLVVPIGVEPGFSPARQSSSRYTVGIEHWLCHGVLRRPV